MNKPINIYIDDTDPNRPIIHSHWDGWSRAIYIYKDELELPDHMRTHIIGKKVQ